MNTCRTAAPSANSGSAKPTPTATTCCGSTPKAGIGAFPAPSATTSSRRHAASIGGFGVVVYGFFIDGTLRGAAELRPAAPLAREAEAAFSIEQPWQSHGVGSVLLERILLTARNRGIAALQMQCLGDNRRMQQLARKFDADLKFDFGSVVGEVDASAPHAAVAAARMDRGRLGHRQRHARRAVEIGKGGVAVFPPPERGRVREGVI